MPGGTKISLPPTGPYTARTKTGGEFQKQFLTQYESLQIHIKHKKRPTRSPVCILNLTKIPVLMCRVREAMTYVLA